MESTHAPLALFPGQGSQHVGMGKDLFENFKSAREVYEEASDALHLDLRKLCFDGPESDLTLTENTQPCLLTTSIAAYRVACSEFGFAPSVVAGHSLGEYSALVAIGAFPLSSTVRWVRERGLAMQRAVPPGEGSMAAIMGLEEDAIRRLCERATAVAKEKRSSGESAALTVDAIVEPANFNAPGQIVIAGSSDGIREAIALIQTPEFQGGKAIPLQVSAPFHCKLMKPARERMAELFLKATERERPTLLPAPYVPNRTARLTQEPGVVFDLLVEQVDHPVLWLQSVQTLLEAGHTAGVEFGPGKVLAGLVKRIARTTEKKCEIISVGDTSGIQALDQALKTTLKATGKES